MLTGTERISINPDILPFHPIKTNAYYSPYRTPKKKYSRDTNSVVVVVKIHVLSYTVYSALVTIVLRRSSCAHPRYIYPGLTINARQFARCSTIDASRTERVGSLIKTTNTFLSGRLVSMYALRRGFFFLSLLTIKRSHSFRNDNWKRPRINLIPRARSVVRCNFQPNIEQISHVLFLIFPRFPPFLNFNLT